MAVKTINIEFNGFWRDKKKSGVPAKSGVYCVYECKYRKTENPVSLLALIYIGESNDVKDRIAGHEKYEDWLKHVGNGNELCYSIGAIGITDRGRAEAAMIFKHKPPENDEYMDSFPFDKTTMSLTGKTALLNTNFTVERTED